MASRRTPEPSNDRAVRISDVAEAAGVSTATVSRALAFPDRLRPETRERVLAAVRRLGYTPNEAARALRAGASRMVLVVVPYLYSGAFFAGVINSIDAELSVEGYTMIVGSLDGIEEKARRLVDLVYARQIDGVIVLTGRIPVIDGRSLRDAGVPIVSICCEMDLPQLPTVLVNDEESAIAQTRHLIDLGHRHLLYVSGREGHYNEIVRYRGYLKAAKASNAKTLRYVGAYTFESGASAARYFLSLDPRPTGVVCCSDEMAIGFIKTVTSAGVAIPGEVSVVGFDGIEFGDYCEPTLTTIRQPSRELGAAGARALLASLRGEARATDSPIVLRGELLVRDSSGPAPMRRKRGAQLAMGGAARASPKKEKIERAAD
jgi:LacI family transcriptional regulator, repressor for deo operon, udp, cdd, tsx, nupC, and nupG